MMLYSLLFVIAATYVSGSPGLHLIISLFPHEKHNEKATDSDSVPEKSHKWGYGPNNGPKTWGKAFGSCNGKLQSPIDLDDSEATPTGALFYWQDDDQLPTSLELFNNGDTVILNGTWEEGKRPSIVLNETDTYLLDRVMWHWGKEKADGSEHTVNGTRFDMEMQIVFKEDGESKQLVYGQFYEIEPNDDGNTPGINQVAENLAAIKKPNSSKSINPFKLEDLISFDPMAFFLYAGSMTTPPCTENVQWLIGSDATAIAKKDIEEFRKLVNKDGKPMVNNIRPIQPRNGREVFLDLSEFES